MKVKIFSICFFAIFYADGFAQAVLKLPQLSIRDTTLEIFSQKNLSAYIKDAVSISLDDNDDFGLSPNGMINLDSSYLEILFEGESNWISCKKIMTPTVNAYPLLLLQPGLKLPVTLNLLSIFIRYPNIWEYAQYGVNAHLRFRTHAQIDFFSYENYYSEHIPISILPASELDKGAFDYLKSSFKDPDGYAYLEYEYTFAFYEKSKWILEQYPGSMIAEIAQFILYEIDLHDKILVSTSQDFQDYYKSKTLDLMSSRSDLVKNFLKIRIASNKW